MRDRQKPAEPAEPWRAFLAELGSGCSLPVGAHASGGTLWTFLADLDSGITASERIELTGDDDADIERARQAARDAREHVSRP